MAALRVLFLLCLFCHAAGWVKTAHAINWEGHDDWFVDSIMIEEFTRTMPQPLAKPMPSCAERSARNVGNVYEQIPIPGVNCRDGARPRSPGSRTRDEHQ